MNPSARGFAPVAQFNLAVTDEIMVCDCTLVKAPDGRVLLYGPGKGSNTLSVSPMMRHQIVEMALGAVGMRTDAAAAI